MHEFARRFAIVPIILLIALSETPAASVSDESIKSAIQLFEQGKYAQARDIFLAATKNNPNNAEAAYYLGRISFVEEDWESSIEWFETAVKLDGRNAVYHMWLGRAYGREAQQASIFRKPSLAGKTKSAFEKAVSLDPENVDARLYLMEFYRRAPGIAGGSKRKAREQAEEVKKRNPYQGHVVLGALYEDDEQYQLAEKEYLAAVQLRPDSSSAYFSLGSLYTTTKQYDKAFEAYAQLLRVNPRAVRAYYQIGRVAAISGKRLDEGEQSLKTFLQHEPRDADSWLSAAHWRLGIIYEKQGKNDLARKEYEASLRLDPKRKEAAEALEKLR
jgi:tetratricopeptide (TPR) repeat protein